MIRQILGATLLTVPFVVVAYYVGLREFLICAGLAALSMAVISAGVYLLTGTIQ